MATDLTQQDREKPTVIEDRLDLEWRRDWVEKATGDQRTGGLLEVVNGYRGDWLKLHDALAAAERERDEEIRLHQADLSTYGSRIAELDRRLEVAGIHEREHKEIAANLERRVKKLRENVISACDMRETWRQRYTEIERALAERGEGDKRDAEWLRNCARSRPDLGAVYSDVNVGVLHAIADRLDPPAPKEKAEDVPFTLERARELGVCRYCGGAYGIEKGTGGWRLNFGKEYAHERCYQVARRVRAEAGRRRPEAKLMGLTGVTE